MKAMTEGRRRQIATGAHHLAMSKNSLCCQGWTKQEIDLLVDSFRDKLYYLNDIEEVLNVKDNNFGSRINGCACRDC